MSQTPSVGRIVLYTLTEANAVAINIRRQDAQNSEMANDGNGVQAHIGNAVSEGDVYPLIITRVWDSGSVNGQVLLDGTDLFWATSVVEGDRPGTFAWPSREG